MAVIFTFVDHDKLHHVVSSSIKQKVFACIPVQAVVRGPVVVSNQVSVLGGPQLPMFVNGPMMVHPLPK